MASHSMKKPGVSAGLLGAGVCAAALVAFASPGCGPDIVETPTPTGSATATPTASGPTPTPTATPVGQTPTPTPAEGCTTIRAMQDLLDPNHPELGERVTVCGAIVTAIDEDRTIFIGSPAGGQFSGIYVYSPNGAGFIPNTIAVGDKVNVTGEYDEAFGAYQLALFSNQEPASAVTVLSSGNPLPPPTLITDLASIATDCETDISGASAYKYEGVRVQVQSVTVTDLDPCGQGQYGVFEVGDTLFIDDDLRKDYTPTETGGTIDSITGILHFAFDRFRVFPGPGDIVLEGGLPTPPPDPACTRIEDIQNPLTDDGPIIESEVKVCDVVVTAVDSRGRFFVQEADGTDYSGIYVFKNDSFTHAEGFAVGHVVDIRATYTSFEGINQLELASDPLKDPRVDVKSTGATLPTPVAVADVTTIATPCVAEGVTPVDGADVGKYEGVRVSFGGVEVTSVDPCGQGSFGVFEVTGGLYIDDDFGMDYDPSAAGDTLSSVAGVLHTSFDHARVFPGAGDVTVAAAEARQAGK